MIPSELEEILQPLLAVVRLDVQFYPDLLITGGYGFVQAEKTAKVRVAFQLSRELLNPDPSSRSMYYKCGRHAAGQSLPQLVDENAAIRLILEATASETGDRYFAALVRYLCQALDVAGSWVAEYIEEPPRLRALSFWFQDHYIESYEYTISGTPCEPVITQRRLLHYQDNILELFPGDTDLEHFRAAS